MASPTMTRWPMPSDRTTPGRSRRPASGHAANGPGLQPVPASESPGQRPIKRRCPAPCGAHSCAGTPPASWPRRASPSGRSSPRGHRAATTASARPRVGELPVQGHGERQRAGAEAVPVLFGRPRHRGGQAQRRPRLGTRAFPCALRRRPARYRADLTHEQPPQRPARPSLAVGTRDPPLHGPPNTPAPHQEIGQPKLAHSARPAD